MKIQLYNDFSITAKFILCYIIQTISIQSLSNFNTWMVYIWATFGLFYEVIHDLDHDLNLPLCFLKSARISESSQQICNYFTSNNSSWCVLKPLFFKLRDLSKSCGPILDFEKNTCIFIILFGISSFIQLLDNACFKIPFI